MKEKYVKKESAIVRASKSKEIIQTITYEDFKMVCDGIGVVEDSLKGLLKIVEESDDDKLRADIYKWLIEMNVGKAKQAVDMTSKGEKITAGIFVEALFEGKEKDEEVPTT